MSKAFVCTSRLNALAISLVLVFSVLVGRLVYLHVFEHDRLSVLLSILGNPRKRYMQSVVI